MTILIDADGCPVVDLTLQIAKQFGIPVIILCDTAHQIEREGAQTLVFDKGADSELGKIKRAYQGQFSIEDRDANTPYIKRIRVVTTIDYSLED